MKVDVKLTEIREENGELSATFRVFATIDERFMISNGEFNDFIGYDPDVMKYHKWSWASDESYEVVDAYLFDYEFLYDALREALYYQIPIDGLSDGEYKVSADLIEDFTGVGIEPIGNDKYSGEGVEWIPADVKLVDFQITKI